MGVALWDELFFDGAQHGCSVAIDDRSVDRHALWRIEQRVIGEGVGDVLGRGCGLPWLVRGGGRSGGLGSDAVQTPTLKHTFPPTYHTVVHHVPRFARQPYVHFHPRKKKSLF